MSDKQRTAFDQWFDSELDPELNLTPGDKELCRHAWQAALSHAEGEAGSDPCQRDIKKAQGKIIIRDNSKETSVVWTEKRWIEENVPNTAPQVAVPGDSDICERVELPHVLAWADGIRGDMLTEYADRITDEEARVAQAVWAAHTGEQPVSGPDGVPAEPVPWPKREDITEDMRAGFERLYRAKAERDGRTLERNDQGAYAHLTVDADWIFYQRAWADALEATAAPTPTKGEEIHINVDGDSVYTLPLEPTGMEAPRFVVHVPAPDEREAQETGFVRCVFLGDPPKGYIDWYHWASMPVKEGATIAACRPRDFHCRDSDAPDERGIAARALDEFRTGPLRSACLSYDWYTESDAYIVDRMLDEEASLLRAGKEGEPS